VVWESALGQTVNTKTDQRKRGVGRVGEMAGCAGVVLC
jgi:hypothetical protein